MCAVCARAACWPEALTPRASTNSFTSPRTRGEVKEFVDALGVRASGQQAALAQTAHIRHLCSPASHAASRRLAVAPGFRVVFEGAEAGLPMKVTVERAELLKSLGHVHRVVERRNTIPILANVLIKAERGKLSMKATDLDLEVIDSVAAEVSPGGATTVPAHMFYEIVRKLPEGSQIVIEGSDDRAVLSLRAGRSRFTLQTLPESDFPDLAAGELTLPEGAAGMPGIIVPRKTVGEVQRLIETGEGEVAIELSAGKIRFSIGDVVLTSKLIDGTFPDYARVIPANNDKSLTVDKKDFEAAVDRVSTVSSERGRAVKLSITGGRLVLSVTNPDSGSATEELEVEYASDPLDIGFNSRYLLDIAAQIEGEVAVLKLADPGSPTLIQDKDAKGALYVLMPMRV